MHIRALILPALLVVSCAAPSVVAPTPATSPTLAAVTAVATASAPVATAAPSPIFAASECTIATATTRQVIERYLALSTSNNAQAVTDCFARTWRDKTPTFADGAALWARSGPATNVGITFVDAVKGCDRFGVNAQLSNSAVRVPPFFSVGTEAGRMRIYETSTALVNPSSTTLRCG